MATTDVAMADSVATSEELQQEQFLKDLNNFMKQRGTPIPPAPTFGGKPFDLCALYKHVTDRGGLENVLKERLWNSIVQLVELPADCPNPAYTLRVLYLKYLYAYERRHFLYIDDDEGSLDYAPKLRATTGAGGAAAGVKPTAPMNRPVLRLDYRRTPLPAESNRLRNKIKDILQLQRISFALRSGSTTTVQWGLEVLALKSYQGEVVLRNGVVGGGVEDGGVTLSVGNALLSSLADLAKNYYTTTPSLLWKSEKVPDGPNETHILAILRNLTLVSPNEVEMAAHARCVEFLILALAHPTPVCVDDALETLASLSYHLVLKWEANEENGENEKEKEKENEKEKEKEREKENDKEKEEKKGKEKEKETDKEKEDIKKEKQGDTDKEKDKEKDTEREKEREKERENAKTYNSNTLSVEQSRILVTKICNLLGEGMPATLPILANITGQAANWPYLESVFAEVPNLVDRIDAMYSAGDESGNALKIIFNISRYGTKTKQQLVRAKGIMQGLIRTLGLPKSEEEIDDVHQLVVETFINFSGDPATKQDVLLYESELLHLILLESVVSDSVTHILSTLANP